MVGFHATLSDGRSVGGKIMAKKDAKIVYDEAVARRDNAFYAGRSSADMFTVSVGNVEPKTRVVVTLRCVGTLTMEGEAVKVRVPLALVPRYVPDPSRMAARDVADSGTALTVTDLEKLVIAVKARLGSPITGMGSPSHDGVELLGLLNGWWQATFSPAVPQLQSDFVMLIHSEVPDTPTIVTESAPDGHHAALLSFVPKIKGGEGTPMEIIFVIDRSGSMQGAKINVAKKAMGLFLRSLPEGSQFDIVSFGSRFTSLFGKSAPYNSETLMRATAAVEGMGADYGGTELFPVVESLRQRAFVTSEPEQCSFVGWLFDECADAQAMQRRVIVLTDGEVANTGMVIDAVSESFKKSEGRERWFTLGLGEGASAELVNGMAKAGRGVSEMVPGNNPEAAVLRQLRRATQVYIEDARAVWVQEDGSECDGVLAPDSNGGALFSGTRFTVPAIFESGGGLPAFVRVVGRLSDTGERYAASAPVTFSGDKTWTGEAIAQVAARDILDQIQRDSPNDVERILALALRYSIVTPYTSFVAVIVKPPAREDLKMAVEEKAKADRQGYVEEQKARTPSKKRRSAKEKFGNAPSAPIESDKEAAREAARREYPERKAAKGRDEKRMEVESEMDEEAEHHAPEQNDSSDLATQLALMVSFEGTWTADAHLASLLGLPLATVEGFCKTCASDPHVCATALVLAWLDKVKLSGDDRFILVVQKARKAIQRAGQNPDTLIANAAKCF